MGLGVLVDKVDKTLKTVSESLGVKVNGSISARSVSCIVQEGGIAAQMQIAHTMQTTKSN